MLNSIFRFCIFLLFMTVRISAFAQDSLASDRTQMAEGMRSNGKIYVVVTVLVIILAGLFIYLGRLDKKINRLEKKDNLS
jgi:hypothetical protein